MDVAHVSLLPIPIATFIVVATAAGDSVRQTSKWWWFGIACGVMAAFVGTVLQYVFQDGSRNVLLIRDLIAHAILSFLIPLSATYAAYSQRNKSVWIRITFAFSVALGVTAISPVIILIIHCTSGDCL